MSRLVRIALLALVSFGSLAAAVYLVGTGAIMSALGAIRWQGLALAALLLVGNNALAFFRFRSVLGAFGFRPELRPALFAYSVGQVSNQVLLNVIGQSLTRAAALARAGIPPGISVMATYLERLQAAVMLFAFSLIGGWYLLLQIRIDFTLGGAYLASVLGALAAVAAVNARVVLRQLDIPAGSFGAVTGFVVRSLPSLLLTLGSHACMLGAYLALLWGIGLETIDAGIVAAIVVVMFTASLPISFSGWGIRELSATQALGVVGVAPSMALAGAVAVGLLGLVLTFAFAGIAAALMVRQSLAPAQGRMAERGAGTAESAWMPSLVLGTGVLCAMLLFFQVRIPLDHGPITVNIADAVALTGLGTALILGWLRHGPLPLPRGVAIAVGLLTVVIIGSWLHGLVLFGSNSWASANRAFGWLIILGYIACGASLALERLNNSRQIIVSVLIATGATIATIQLGLLFLTLISVPVPPGAVMAPLEGYANNSNAFAFQLFVTAVAALAGRHLGLFDRREWLFRSILIILGLAICYTRSRAGLGMFAMVLVLAVLLPGTLSRRRLAADALWAMVVCVFALSAPLWLFQLLNHVLVYLGLRINADITLQLIPYMVREGSDSERWMTLADGWQMWLANPVFGQGLGAYIESRLAAGKIAIVIHSVPVWLLAETGLAGLLVVAGVLLYFLRRGWLMRRDPASAPWGTALVILLVCASAAGTVHDLFFQRSFWFFAGLALAAALPPAQPAPEQA